MTIISAVILVAPTAKGRPRMAVVGGHVMAYTPKATRMSEEQIKYDIRRALPQLVPFPAGTPLKLTATFYRARPKHLPKRVIMPVQKPDVTNYTKLLEDALNGYCFPSDAQITSMDVRKRFAENGTQPRIELKIEEDR